MKLKVSCYLTNNNEEYRVFHLKDLSQVNSFKTQKISDLADLLDFKIPTFALLFLETEYGVWRSPVSVPALGAGGRRFESYYPDV